MQNQFNTLQKALDAANDVLTMAFNKQSTSAFVMQQCINRKYLDETCPYIKNCISELLNQDESLTAEQIQLICDAQIVVSFETQNDIEILNLNSLNLRYNLKQEILESFIEKTTDEKTKNALRKAIEALPEQQKKQIIKEIDKQCKLIEEATNEQFKIIEKKLTEEQKKLSDNEKNDIIIQVIKKLTEEQKKLSDNEKNDIIQIIEKLPENEKNDIIKLETQNKARREFIEKLENLEKQLQEQQEQQEQKLKEQQNQIETALDKLTPEGLLVIFNEATKNKTKGELDKAKTKFIKVLKDNTTGIGTILDLTKSDGSDDDQAKVKAFADLAGNLFDSYAKNLKKDTDNKLKPLEASNFKSEDGEGTRAFIFGLIKFVLVIPAVLELLGIGDKYLQSAQAKKNEAKAAHGVFRDSLASDKNIELIKQGQQESFKALVKEQKAAGNSQEVISKQK